MFAKGWQQRQQNAKDKLAAKADLAADAEHQAKQAARRAHLLAQEEAARAEQRDALLARQGPAAAVARVMIERLAEAVPDVVAVLSKAEGRAKVMAALEVEVVRKLRSARPPPARSAPHRWQPFTLTRPSGPRPANEGEAPDSHMTLTLSPPATRQRRSSTP